MKTRTKQPTFTDARGREHSTAEFAAAADRINPEAQPTRHRARTKNGVFTARWPPHTQDAKHRHGR